MINVWALVMLVLGAVELSAGSTASIALSGRVDPIAVLAVTQAGISTGDVKSYVSVRNGIKTIHGEGLIWTVNHPGARIFVRGDGGLKGLTVRAVNEVGGTAGGTVLLGYNDQELVADILLGTGHCDLEYKVPTSSEGEATVIFTISAQ